MAGPGKRNVTKTPDWPATTDKRRFRTMKIPCFGMGKSCPEGFSNKKEWSRRASDSTIYLANADTTKTEER